MVSTFHGLEVAKRGLFTQQSALYTTGNNIANANTPGYTRQRVNFEQTAPYPPASRNRPEIPGQIGSGVQAGSVERIRVEYLDSQFRGENNKTGYFETLSSAFNRLEGLMNEPSESGLAKTMDRFWGALQDLSTNPQDSGARSVVKERGQAVANTFNYLANSLKTMQKDIKTEVGVTKDEINAILNNINNLNQQIGKVEPHSMVPNKLYDERDLLIDQLSKLVNINVSYESTPSSASSLAMGKVTIQLADENGKALEYTDASGNTSKATLVDGAANTYTKINVDYDNYSVKAKAIEVGPMSITAEDFQSPGKLLGLVESGGYIANDGSAKGTYEDMLYDLDKLATGFAEAFNSVHGSGWSLNEIEGGTNGNVAFFEVTGTKDANNVITDFASSIDLNQLIKDDVDNIAAANDQTPGNGENALNLADINNKNITLLGNEASVESFYQSMIGTMAVQAQEAIRMTGNSATLRDSVSEQRQSVSSVSLDEEMSNMIKFQHAYNAAARNMTAVDEMIDRIINQMGLVGR